MTFSDPVHGIKTKIAATEVTAIFFMADPFCPCNADSFLRRCAPRRFQAPEKKKRKMFEARYFRARIMGLGCVIEKRRQQWCSEFVAVKADMGLMPDKDVSPLCMKKTVSWQVFCQMPAEAANQDECVTPLVAAAL